MLFRGYLLIANISFKHFGFTAAEEIRGSNVHLPNHDTKVLDFFFNMRLIFSKLTIC